MSENQSKILLVDDSRLARNSIGEIRVTSRCEGEEIVLQVADNGCGISEKDLTRIFDPFFTTRGVGKGSGLGLTIAYDIIHKHGGTLAVESRASC